MGPFPSVSLGPRAGPCRARGRGRLRLPAVAGGLGAEVRRGGAERPFRVYPFPRAMDSPSCEERCPVPVPAALQSVEWVKETANVFEDKGERKS